ncbi:MAG: cobalamin-dependent protein [Candidatus Omnitrophica bacterium]|nr:cobalamin-dependent protein [Candidatus Omnitrophota bacterium]
MENRALLWLASYLVRQGFRVKVFYLEGDFKDVIKRAMEQYRPKYAVASCKWYTSLYGAVLVAEEIRRIDKSVKIIAGGHTAAYFDKELLQNSEFDIIIRGDGEIPLANILKNKAPVNCTIKQCGHIRRYKLGYVQGEKDLSGYRLVDPEMILEDAKHILGNINFVWTGKGCKRDCFYCGGALKMQNKLFGRRGLIYRPIRDVLADIATLSRYSKYIMFDFSCPPHADSYYLRLFKKVPKQRLNCRFYHWGMPSEEIISQISKTFIISYLHLDTSTLSERLRISLSKRKLLKSPFRNKELEEIISYCNSKGNIRIVLENISGLPGERNMDVRRHIDFSLYLAKKYPSIENIFYQPLSIEPGSMLQRQPLRLKMCSFRKNFNDFINFGRHSFYSKVAYPFSGFFDTRNYQNAIGHPYGVYEHGLDRKSSYRRTTKFDKETGKELLANCFVNQVYAKHKKDIII